MICPKCNFEQSDKRIDCIKCGIIFDKYTTASRPPVHAISGNVRHVAEVVPDDPGQGVIGFIKELFLYVKSDINPFYFGGRVVVFLLILFYGIKLMTLPLETNAAGKSFLHMINLPFHEAGHIIFRPFGQFLATLGGSLMQLIVPLICLVVFLIRSRDTFGASIALWWFGESFMDLAPYINDARPMRMVLIGGITGWDYPDFHDWHHILRDLDMLKYDNALASAAHTFGIVLMIMSFAWGGYLLFRQFKNIDL